MFPLPESSNFHIPLHQCALVNADPLRYDVSMQRGFAPDVHALSAINISGDGACNDDFFRLDLPQYDRTTANRHAMIRKADVSFYAAVDKQRLRTAQFALQSRRRANRRLLGRDYPAWRGAASVGYRRFCFAGLRFRNLAFGNPAFANSGFIPNRRLWRDPGLGCALGFRFDFRLCCSPHRVESFLVEVWNSHLRPRGRSSRPPLNMAIGGICIRREVTKGHFRCFAPVAGPAPWQRSCRA